ncbi:hypothetical protein [Pseudarthrobacter sp. S9]|uniref:hypothetical protein n=1 Tax=Pseudarthrobacter sp. S9 TaxID=3418421 RepID=UPI003CFD83B8
MQNPHIPHLEIPYRKAENRPVLDRNERLRLLDDILENDSRPLHYRTAAVLLLLYAQP